MSAFILKQDANYSALEKRERVVEMSNVDEAVFTWYKQHFVEVPVRGTEIQLAAEKFAVKSVLQISNLELDGFADSEIGIL